MMAKDTDLVYIALLKTTSLCTFVANRSHEKNYTENLTVHDFYVSPDVMENPTYDPNSVSCSPLPDFLSEVTLIILTLSKYS